MSQPLFTIFTPTFNSSKFIHRVYESVASQTYRQFEWVVVDDASQDDTLDLLREYQKTADFPVSIVAKPANRGGLDSYNMAVATAKGEFLVAIGHDDRFRAHTLQFLVDAWNAIPSAQQSRYCGITVQCCNEAGEVAEDFPVDGMESNSLEMYFVYKCRAEQWSIFRTDVLRQYSFPSEYRMGEGAFVWFPMAERYQSKYFNAPLRIYYRDNPGSVANTQDPKKYAKELAEVYHRMFDYATRYAARDLATLLLLCARYLRFSSHMHRSFPASIRRLRPGWRWIGVACSPIAGAMLLRDQIKKRRAEVPG